nr:asparagine synthetase B [Mariniflexile sp.]
MCGIAGFIDFNKKSSKKLLENMTNVLAHRGPDDCGYSFYETNTAQVGLGHRRLSILDLSSLGHQPMKFNDLEIIYNGEIYNFKEIRSELITLGFEFASDSDTEVIIKSFSCWGDTAVHKFNGMFALAIFD